MNIKELHDKLIELYFTYLGNNHFEEGSEPYDNTEEVNKLLIENSSTILDALRQAIILQEISEGKSLIINSSIVQFIKGNEWHTAYYKKPKEGTPDRIHESIMDAIKYVVKEARESK